MNVERVWLADDALVRISRIDIRCAKHGYKFVQCTECTDTYGQFSLS